MTAGIGLISIVIASVMASISSPNRFPTTGARHIQQDLAAFVQAQEAPAQEPSAQEAPGQEAPDGKVLYEAGCAVCHGADGGGSEQVQLSVEVPDFGDCEFAPREPDADWIAVAHGGGPARGFDEAMPAFGTAFNAAQLQAIMDHIRTFCTDDSWPRGELNLPRPFVTEKAYPEDELVWSTSTNLEDPDAFGNKLVYERRFGARHQLEIVVPFGFQDHADMDDLDGPEPDDLDGPDSDWEAGLGDIALGWKTAVYHSLQSGSIFSVAGEVKLPTGDEDDGFGKGTVVLEPFVSFGQIISGDAFLHAQAGAEFPLKTDNAANELFWRAVLGRTWTQGDYGRAWSPMIELLGAAEFEDDETVVAWDLIPQMQVTLNTRQHVMLNVGVRFPLTHASERSTQLLVYVLWDWFDGGLFSGW